MKTKFHHILIITSIALTALTISSYAQENGVVESEFPESFPEKFETAIGERERAERERILNSPGEGETRYIPPRTNTTPPVSSTATRESSSKETLKESDLKTGIPVQHKVKPENANTRPSKSPEKPQPTQAKPNDDDNILSFNFLYYIIQKYKLQDIVD